MTLEAISLRLLVPDLVLPVTLPSAGRLSMASHASIRTSTLFLNHRRKVLEFVENKDASIL